MNFYDYERIDGNRYNRFRPSPPQEFIAEVLRLSGENQFECVVDLGCGTGLSTVVWKELARQVVGIEPNRAFRDIAKRENSSSNIEYLEAFAQDTGLPDAIADIVTAVNSIHYLDPEPVFREIDRLLKPVGLFVSFGATTFTIYDFEANARFHQVIKESLKLLKKYNLHRPPTIQPGEDLDVFFENPALFGSWVEWTMREREDLKAEEVCGRVKTLGFVEACMHHNLENFAGSLEAFEVFLTQRYLHGMIPYSTSYEVKIGKKAL